ncbi:hypothetical protein M514_06080, partial [Trichuris suis]
MGIPDLVPVADGHTEHTSEAVLKTEPVQSAHCEREPRRCWSRLQSSKCLLAVLCLCACAQSMTLNGLVTVSITTIEKRFHLTSSQSGLFSSMYDIGVLVTLLPVCHFGGKGHKGRWIAAGMFLLGLGSLVCTIPHLAGEAYVYGQGKRSGLCQPDVLNLSTPRSHSNHGKESYAYPLLLTGQFLHGTGAAPLYTLGVSYLDESVSQKMSPVYLGLFLSSATVGSAIGFFLGGLLLKINGNIDKSIKASTDVAPGDPSWYGAWWIGFLISSAILFSTTPLLCAFKKELPGAKLYAKERVDQANGMSFGRAIVAGTKQSTTKDLPRLLLALLRNCTFLFIVVKEVLLGFLINGFITFLPKFTETIFLFSVSTSSIVSGGAFIPPAILGNVLGGYLIKWLKLRCRQTILLCILCGILCVLLIPSFLLDYQGTPLAGADIFYNSSNDRSLLQQCNKDCSCDFVYNPVCDELTGVTYFSPCYAGCRKIGNHSVASSYGLENKWEDCRCLIDSPDVPAKESFPLSNVLVHGSCFAQRFTIYIFFTLFILMIFFIFLSAMPTQQALLRCVPFEQRTLALGVDYIFARALGTVPGPIAFGSLIDTACNVWMGSGNELSCVWYDSVKFKTILFTLSITFKLASVLALMVAWKMYRPPSGTKDGAHIRWDRIKWFISWRYTGNPYSFDEGNAVLRSYGKTLK